MANMFGNIGELANMMKKAKEIKENLGKVKDEIASQEFTSKIGRTTVTVTGDFTVKAIKIDGGDPALEQDLLETFNAVMTNAKLASQEKMTALTGGIKLPDLF